MGLIECGWATCDEQGLVEKEGRSRLSVNGAYQMRLGDVRRAGSGR